MKGESEMVTVGELFCGAGVGAVAIHERNLEVVYAYDNMRYAVDTYNHNFGDIAEVVDLKVKPYSEIPYVDLIVAGFPCQPFSFNGKQLGEKDPDKGNLGKITYEIIKHKKPKYFILENVKGLASKKNKPFLLKLVSNLSEDYSVSWDIVNCAWYGVPQNRERVFIIGVRRDLNTVFKFPTFTHKDNPVSLREAIGDIKIKGSYIPNHKEDCGIRNDEAPFIKYISDGQCWKHLPKEEMKKEFMKGSYHSSGGKTTYLSVIDKDKPARTILSSPKGKNSSQILKWEGQEHRRYTVRESLRLQTVPDWWEFPEHIGLMKQYERCSGIPPLVLGKFLDQLLEETPFSHIN